MKFNQPQKRALTHYLQTNESLTIEALAGTGKTTFLVGTSHVLKHPNSSLFVTFTNSSKDNLIERLPNFEKSIKTTYSLGFVCLLREFGNLKVDGFKTFKQLKRYEPRIKNYLFSYEGRPCNDRLLDIIKKEIVQLYNLALCNLYASEGDILSLCNSTLSVYGQDPNFNFFKSQLTANLIKANIEKPPTSLSFSEMIALPYYFNLSPYKVKEILVDEAQDQSKAQQNIVKQAAYNNAQVILVGDENQSIFSFAGSDANSFKNMTQMFNCKVFTMPINYRCGTEIIKYANEIVGSLESPTNWHKGQVASLSYEQAFSKALSTEKDTLVISRTFRVLVKFGLALLREDKPFSYSKNTLEESINGQIDYYKSKFSFSTFPDALESDIIKAERNSKAFLHDLLSSLEYFYHHSNPKNYEQLKRSVSTFFSYAKVKSNILLSTIHSAKGLEAHTVIHLGNNHLPHYLSTTPEQLQQERNLDYVARTRAKHRYYLVNIPR